MPEETVTCVQPARGLMVESETDGQTPEETPKKEVVRVQARVGAPAPDFEAGGYHAGEFVNVKLSDYRGKWVVLCFYPGDFTFV
jgi:hypothetical protein